MVHKEEILLERSMKDVEIANVSINGKQLTIKNGKVLPAGRQVWGETDSSTRQKALHLTAFYQWTKEDPLFYSPDFNVEEFVQSVELLSKEHDKLLEVIGGEKHLHPVDFLESMSEVAALTREFMDKPSDKLAEQLIEKQKLAAHHYKEEASGLLDSLPQDEPPLVGFSIIVSYETMKHDLEKVRENGDQLLEEIARRERCFSGNGACTRPALKLAEPKTMIGRTEQTQTLPTSLVFNRSREDIPKATIRGPYQARTICFGWGENFSSSKHSFFLEERTPNTKDGSPLASYPIIDIQLATGAFFKNINPSTDVAVLKELLQRGIKIIHFPSANPYMCPQRNFVAQVSELDIFKNDLKPIFPKVKIAGNIGSFFARANRVEESFFAKESPSYHDLLVLSDYYEYAYQLIVKNPSVNWAEDLYLLKDEFFERHLRAKRKLDNIHLVFNNTTRFVNSLWVRRFVEKDVDASVFRNYAYYERNFYGLYFLPFTPSIWRTNELQYIDKTVVKNALGEDAAYMTYDQVRQLYTEEDIASWSAINRREILEELLLDVDF